MEKRDRELLEITLLENFKRLVDKTLFYSHKEEILCEEDIDSYIKDNENKRQGIYSILSELGKERDEEETVNLIEKINLRLSMYEASRIKEYLMNSEFAVFKDDIDKFISSIEKRFLEVEEAMDSVSLDEEVKPTIVIETTEVVLPNEETEVGENPLGNTTKLLKIIDDRIKVLEEETKEEEDSEEISFFKKEGSTLEHPTETDMNNLFDPIKSEEKKEEDMDAFELSRHISESMNTKLSREEIDGFIQKIDDKLAELEREEQALSTTKYDIPVE